MEKYLPYAPYITDIIKTSITTIAAIFALWISVWKYLDIRDREEKRRKYDNLCKVIETLIKFTESHEPVNAPSLIFTIYQLQNYREYSKIISPVLINVKTIFIASQNPKERNVEQVQKAIDIVLQELGVRQIATSGFSSPPRNDNHSIESQKEAQSCTL